MAVLKFGTYQAPTTDPITADLDWWTPVEGSPTMKTWLEHQTDDGKFLTGYGQATPGSYRVDYIGDEYIYMFEGEVTLIEDGGETRTFKAGDTFFIEAGFKGIWKTEKTIRKLFAIHVR